MLFLHNHAFMFLLLAVAASLNALSAIKLPLFGLFGFLEFLLFVLAALLRLPLDARRLRRRPLEDAS